MSYYKTCPACGSNLDPGEKCDCQQEKDELQKYILQHTDINKKTGQIFFDWDHKGRMICGEKQYFAN
jgi:hypothetical protein